MKFLFRSITKKSVYIIVLKFLLKKLLKRKKSKFGKGTYSKTVVCEKLYVTS